MSVNAVNAVAAVGATYNETPKDNGKTTEKKEATPATQEAVVYEKSEATKPATYSINKMSAEDRANLVQQLKADQESRQQNLLNIVQQMLGGQAKSYAYANGDESIWKFLASGKFTVDPATKAQAQADIAEDGYWGVEQTSDRMVSMAQALSGGNPEYADKMIAAIKKGFDQATEAWGEDLPDICKNTIDAAVKKMEDWRDSLSGQTAE